MDTRAPLVIAPMSPVISRSSFGDSLKNSAWLSSAGVCPHAAAPHSAAMEHAIVLRRTVRMSTSDTLDADSAVAVQGVGKIGCDGYRHDVRRRGNAPSGRLIRVYLGKI